MMRSLYLLPLALLLAAGYPTPTPADDMAEQCRKMAAEDEVAPEDLEDYIAECLAVVQSESAEEAAGAMERMDSVAGEAETPKEAPAAPASKSPDSKP